MLKKKLGIEGIERNWWSNKNLTTCFKITSTLTIPEDCERIGKCAFWGCKRLEKVIIPNSIERIEECTFNDCRKLKIVIISEGVREIGEMAFEFCERLEKVLIPESVEKIEYRSFGSCYNATITLKKPVSEFKYINPYAFICKDVKEEIRS